MPGHSSWLCGRLIDLFLGRGQFCGAESTYHDGFVASLLLWCLWCGDWSHVCLGRSDARTTERHPEPLPGSVRAGDCRAPGLPECTDWPQEDLADPAGGRECQLRRESGPGVDGSATLSAARAAGLRVHTRLTPPASVALSLPQRGGHHAQGASSHRPGLRGTQPRVRRLPQSAGGAPGAGTCPTWPALVHHARDTASAGPGGLGSAGELARHAHPQTPHRSHARSAGRTARRCGGTRRSLAHRSPAQLCTLPGTALEAACRALC
mmetsp:Transcript_15611/g.46770  ORF Transcript_15611/g.46770 Transcript_15611/m.46770 type:complete len:265 (-) Transcript_15611:1728-2522(-)